MIQEEADETLSNVSIAKPVNDKIVRTERGNKNEIVGLLLGRFAKEVMLGREFRSS